VGNAFPGLVGTVGIQLDAIAKCFGAAGDCLESSTVAYAGASCSATFTLAAPSEPPPHRGINRQTAAYARREVDETAVVTERPISEQTRQQGQGVLGEGRVHKGLLGLKGSRGATAWLTIIVESRVHYLRK